MKSLANMTCGEKGYVTDMQSESACFSLLDVGCFPRDMVEVENINHTTDKIMLKSNHKRFVLSMGDAKAVSVNNINLFFQLN